MADIKLPAHCLATSAPTGPREGPYCWISLLTATSLTLWAAPLAAEREAVQVTSLPCSLSYTPPASQRPDQEVDQTASERIAFPRLVSFAPNNSAVAVAGDDKTLRVWRLPQDVPLPGLSPSILAYGSEAHLVRLPKRAAVLLWEPSRSKGLLHLLVGDRHGDVRSFPIALDGSSLAAPGEKDAEAADMGFFDSEDPLSPRVGHVGMLTDAVYAPLPVSNSYKGAVPPLLITADRDEHIRVSRWGAKRSGWVVEHFVLGSSSFIGALLVVPYPPSLATNRHSALLSADGGTALRLSDYLPSYPASNPAPAQANNFILTIQLDPLTIAPYIRTDVLPSQARRLMRLPLLKSNDVLPPLEERDSIQGYSHLAIVQLALLTVPGASEPSYVLIRLEASTALHVLSLEALYNGSNNVQTTDLGQPIVHSATDTDGQTIYASLDTRAPSSSTQDILALQLSSDGTLVPVKTQQLAPLQAVTDTARPTVEVLGKQGLTSLDLYPALASFPKTASDGSAAETDSSEARIRAAMASGRRAAGREKNLRALFGDQEAGV